MNAIELINETEEYYKTHPRAVKETEDGPVCSYMTPEGNMRAVGRCLQKDSKLFVTLEGSSSVDYFKYASALLDEELRPEYQGHPVELWSELQEWHDLYAGEEDKVEAACGKVFLEDLKIKFGVEIHDNGGETFDRYMAVYICSPSGTAGLFDGRGMSGPPYGPHHPQGFGQCCEVRLPMAGTRIDFDMLPEDYQQVVREDVRMLYGQPEKECPSE